MIFAHYILSNLYGDLGPGARGSAEVVAQPAVESMGQHIVAMTVSAVRMYGSPNIGGGFGQVLL